MKNSLVILLSGLSLFGCASQSSMEHEAALLPVEAESCCQSVSAYPWIFLEQNQDLDFKINPASPADKFTSGNSYFAPFAFDAQSGLVEIVLRSNMENRQVMIPEIALFDQDFKIKKVLSEDAFDIVFSDAFARNRFELVTRIDTVATPYMVIYGDTRRLGEKITVPHPAKLRAQEAGEPMPIVTDPVYYGANSGAFSLQVTTETLSGYNQKQLVQPAPQVLTKSGAAKPAIKAVPETQTYYHNAIRRAVEANELDKALSLLEEAKALNIEGAQEVFIKAVNRR